MIRILIADTHVLFLDALHTLISSAQPTIHLVRVYEPTTFLQEVNNGKWDLIICDISLKKVGRLNAFQKLRKEYPDTKLYIMGIHKQEHVAERVSASGAAGYLQKEMLHEEVLVMIQGIISPASP